MEAAGSSGETERSAGLRLSQDGLTLSGVSEIRSPAYAFDVVVAQDPAADAGAPEVALLVNRPEPEATYVMPDLIGVSGDRAATLAWTKAQVQLHHLGIDRAEPDGQAGRPTQ